MAGGTEIKEEYTSSLADLTFNSKPLISVLTILAEENVAHAGDIVEAIEAHLSRVRTEVKLPVLYLIDCIIKNVGGPYTALFCQNIVSTFCSVFEQVDERTRSEMFRLRQTWSDVIPQKKLYALDVQIKQLDPAWPVTAPPPPIGIHLNPKFFLPTTTSIDGTNTSTPINTNAQKTPMLTGSSSGPNVDPKTISMQQKIINKQRELIELQQKKLQLELLQTQVKLREQLKSTHPPTSTPSVINSRNLLLKPEVAKQLVSEPTTKITTTKSRGGTHARIPKIAPVQSNLLNARPVRDPRLLRQLQQQPPVSQQPQETPIHSSVHSDTKSKSETQVSESDTNKIVNNKLNIRNDRVEHRLIDNNKGNNESHGKSKNLPYSSFLKHTLKGGSSSRSKRRFSRQPKPSPSLSESTDIKHSDPTDLFVKNIKSDSRDKSPVLSKLKFKKKSSIQSDKDSIDNNSGVVLQVEKISDKKSDKHNKNSEKHNKANNKSVFKEFKISSKSRAHIRHNPMRLPTPNNNHDVDLRVVGSPDNKIPRIQNDNTKEKNESPETQKSMDVDLRQSNSTTGKKRTSADNSGSPAKKSKTEMFDVLFGTEDTDLRRQLPVVDARPPTPPPPIISEKAEESEEPMEIIDCTIEEVKEVQTKNANLDALRAKLANAINQDKLKESEELKASVQSRFPSKKGTRENIGNAQIIISAADEKDIKGGNMTDAQKNALMSKILAQMETQQLREAQRRESETFTNISFQPISDDEFEANVSDASDEDFKKRNNKDDHFITKDDRLPELPSLGSIRDDFSLYQRNQDYHEPRRGRPWRSGRHRQKHWDTGPISRPGIRPNFRPLLDPWVRPLQPPPQMNMASFVPAPTTDIPPLIFAHPDTYKFITIDNQPREIRYYDETAIVFLSSGDPREITFHDGSHRICLDNEPFVLHFNSPYEEIFIKGNRHKVRLGGPSREIFIDGNGYECYFDEKEKRIELDGNCILVKLEPPPPQVKIGDKRLDLVAGKTQLVVDAKNMFTVFLDAKVQTFKIDDVEHTLKFVDSLRAAIIDDVRYEIEFGGLPKSVLLKDKKYFIRFSVLPKSIKAGVVRIKDMEVTEVYQSPIHEIEEPPVEFSVNTPPFKIDSPERTSSPGQFQLHHQNLDNLDMLTSVMASSLIPTQNEGGVYSVEAAANQLGLQPEFSQSTINPTFKVEMKQEENKPLFNISDLFQRLVATGIVATATAPPQEPEVKRLSKRFEDFKDYKNSKNLKVLNLKPATLNKPETLKISRPGNSEMLYVGQQCSSCGERFSHNVDNFYKQHLDWHFRQNRKGRKSNRLSALRRWYYFFPDWKNYAEIEDLEDRGKSYFESIAGSGNNEPDDEDIQIPCITADADVADPVCEVCMERLEQFYNEEKEEWQLRMAIRVDDKIYHPLCYDDYQASLIDVTLNTDIHEIPGLDGVEEAPSPEPNDIDDVMEVIDNIDDELEPPPDPTPVVADEHAYKILEENNLIDDDSDEADDDDVIINEVIPERIIVEDDDRDEEYVPSSEVTTIPAIVIKEEPLDDGFIDIEGGLVKVQTNSVAIKTEPVEKSIGASKPNEEKAKKITDTSDSTHIEVVSSIDGNFELESLDSDTSATPPTTSVTGKIKINITKPIPTVITKESHELINESLNDIYVDPNEPLPPGEEPVQLNIKPTLQGIQLKRNPIIKKGSELTGLCSIM